MATSTEDKRDAMVELSQKINEHSSRLRQVRNRGIRLLVFSSLVPHRRSWTSSDTKVDLVLSMINQCTCVRRLSLKRGS
jgi:hypothetical protein